MSDQAALPGVAPGVCVPDGVTIEPNAHRAAHLAKRERRPADTIWRANPREQGLLGVTDAIAYFGGRGWAVSVPLIDSQPYDLVVDDGKSLHRVQVKTTTYRSRYGVFVVSLATRGATRASTRRSRSPTRRSTCSMSSLRDRPGT